MINKLQIKILFVLLTISLTNQIKPEKQSSPTIPISEDCVLFRITSIKSIKHQKGIDLRIEFEYESRCKKNILLPKHIISFELFDRFNKNILSYLQIRSIPNQKETFYQKIVNNKQIIIQTKNNEALNVNSIIKRSSQLSIQSEVNVGLLKGLKIVNLKSDFGKKEQEASFFTKEEEALLDLSHNKFNEFKKENNHSNDESFFTKEEEALLDLSYDKFNKEKK